ncbi:hypothetical protein BD289DRAFT_429296 [Coniella lustricola]|uniref:GDP-fucose protein O-fucosyltransferase-domain-containing protein n=1 Tax=Coniella lustricola TaxID=2025994 RepID=A0A2T3AD31_9PEZI|nr:hypothetical protein BD289DRAFT_429296 [Coniella lustricola]
MPFPLGGVRACHTMLLDIIRPSSPEFGSTPSRPAWTRARLTPFTKTVYFALLVGTAWILIATLERHLEISIFGGSSTNHIDTPGAEEAATSTTTPSTSGHSGFLGSIWGSRPQSDDEKTSSSSSSSKPSTTTSPSALLAQEWTLAEFKKVWLATELGGEPVNTSSIAELCDSTTWRSDVALQMVHSRGGIANVRGTILDFLHFAMRTGSSHIVMPAYVKRTDTTLDWMDESHGYWPFSNLFDADFLLETMHTACPQLNIYQSADEIPNTVAVEETFNVPNARSDKAPDQNNEHTVESFRAWLEADGRSGYDALALNLVNVTATLWAYNVGPYPRLRRALGRLCKINPQIRELAATAIHTLRSAHNLSASIDPRAEIYPGAYYGMHLRTEADATQVGWAEAFGGFEAQTDIHLEQCAKMGLNVIYVASGNEEDISRFADKAMETANITVVSKKDLILGSKDRAKLDELTWDQHGALDWEILARSSFFSGPAMSSFSWNVALRRHFYLEDPRLDKSNPYGIQEVVPHVAFDDGLSRIMLRDHLDAIEIMAPNGMFP